MIITHSTRILESLQVDVTHVMDEGKIVKNGDVFGGDLGIGFVQRG